MSKRNKNQIKSPKFRVKALPYFISVILVALVTLAGEFVKRHLEPANLAMIYLLVVVIVAMRWGRGAAVLTSVLSVLALDFFLVPPYLTFVVWDLQYLFTFAGFLIVGLIVSQITALTAEARQLELLRATEKLQTALLNSISHDLKTPLASITGSLSTLLQDASQLDEKTKNEMLENAFEESDRLNRIVSNLLDITRMEAGALKVSPKPCELRDVLGFSLQELKYKLGQRLIGISIPKDFPEIPMDFSLMAKVFLNLIDNAVKYSPENSPIHIRAKMEEDHARIEILDEGAGIKEEDLKRVFDKFYRAVKPDQISGIGLGLSICKGIIEAHQGKIWAERSPEKGSAFIILLPQAESL